MWRYLHGALLRTTKKICAGLVPTTLNLSMSAPVNDY
jgi:hypothetical protein